MKIERLKTTEADIAEAVKSGDIDSVVNYKIQAYLNNYEINQTVPQWRVENYKQLRSWAYPDPAELNDAQIKINSDIDELATEGQQQLDTYVSNCLDVKTRFPKE